MTLPNANSDHLLLVLFSKLDAEKISDQSTLPNSALSRELAVVIDHLLINFDHWSPGEKSKARADVMDYIATSDRDEFTSDAMLRAPREPSPLGRRIVSAMVFLVFGLAVIILSPITLIAWLTEKPLQEGQYRVSQYKSLCKATEILSRKIWPDRLPSCYCCNSKKSL